MNARKLIAAVAVFAATGSAFAQGSSEFVEFNDFASTRTRAEVKAELVQANPAHETEFVEVTRVASIAPRAAVRVSTYDQSLLNRDPEFVEYVNIASSRSRAEVRGEMQQAAKPVRTAIGG
jgi:hypothetical protein